jgi:predicted ATPase
MAQRMGRKKGKYEVKFLPGVNVLVGPNGSGKSTVLAAVRRKIEHTRDKLEEIEIKSAPGPCRVLDFEKDNPRTKSYFEGGGGIGFQVSSMFSSHGEVTKAILKELDSPTFTGACVLLDEPEAALDMEGIQLLVRMVLACPAHQLIVATHCPVLILHPQVHVVELRRGYRKRVREFYREVGA